MSSTRSACRRHASVHGPGEPRTPPPSTTCTWSRSTRSSSADSACQASASPATSWLVTYRTLPSSPSLAASATSMPARRRAGVERRRRRSSSATAPASSPPRAQPLAERANQLARDGRRCLHHLLEGVAADAQQASVAAHADRRRPLRLADERQLAQRRAGAQLTQHGRVFTGRLVDDLQAPAAHDVEGVGVVALAKQPRARRGRDRVGLLRQRLARLRCQAGEQRHLGEERRVGLLGLRRRRGVAPDGVLRRLPRRSGRRRPRGSPRDLREGVGEHLTGASGRRAPQPQAAGGDQPEADDREQPCALEGLLDLAGRGHADERDEDRDAERRADLADGAVERRGPRVAAARRMGDGDGADEREGHADADRQDGGAGQVARQVVGFGREALDEDQRTERPDQAARDDHQTRIAVAQQAVRRRRRRGPPGTARAFRPDRPRAASSPRPA